MENVDKFIESFKQQLVARGLTIIPDPENTAQNLANIFESRAINAENSLPLFGHDGNEFNPHYVDHEYETLDENSGTFCFLFSIV